LKRTGFSHITHTLVLVPSYTDQITIDAPAINISASQGLIFQHHKYFFAMFFPLKKRCRLSLENISAVADKTLYAKLTEVAWKCQS
jgi:hypothetical protein